MTPLLPSTLEPSLAGRLQEPSRPARKRWSAWLERAWLPALGIPMDAVLLGLAFWAAHRLRFHFPPLVRLVPVTGGTPLPWEAYADHLTALIPLWIAVLFHAGRLYEDPFLPTEEKAVRVLNGCFQATLLTLAVSFLYRRYSDSRLMSLLMFPLASSFIFAGHAGLKAAQRAVLRRLPGRPRLLLVGEGNLAGTLRSRLDRSGHREVHLLAPCPPAGILRRVRDLGASEVILAQTEMDRGQILEVAETLETEGISLKIAPSLLQLRLGELQIDQSLAVPMLRFHHASLSGANFFLKRLFDAAFSAAFLGVFALPLAIVCILIKLDSPGPLLFRQRRLGYKGRPFDLYKFRTMVADAEAQLERFRHLNERPGPVFKMRRDPRVTRFGRLLRRLSLDEVPQFLNVLGGDMSVVGPRPPLPGEVAEYEPSALRRLNVRPGITGLCDGEVLEIGCPNAEVRK